MKRLPVLADGDELDTPTRPRTRGDCIGGVRPCPWVSCRHHMGLYKLGTVVVLADGRRLTADARDDELELAADEVLDRGARVGSCVLDIVDRNPDGLTLDQTGRLLNITRERVRQIERKAKPKAGKGVTRTVGATTLDAVPEGFDGPP